MARVVQHVPPEPFDRLARGYDWDSWFDGQLWELEQGDDFSVAPESFAATARQTAKKRGVSIRVSCRGERAYVKANAS